MGFILLGLEIPSLRQAWLLGILMNLAHAGRSKKGAQRMWQTWRKALVVLAIAMIPIYIGLYMAMKQQAETPEEILLPGE
jgi:hypothetical protein